MKKNRVLSNTVMLYVMTFAKLVLPLLTLPYLTRVLSKESYAMVSYVKNCMTYMQLIIDFGFILSSVKDIAKADGDNDKIGRIAGNTFLAKLMLSALAGGVLAVMCTFIEVLRLNLAFVALSFVSVAITVFLADFLFRGIEKMHYITIIYVVSKSVSTALTFVFVADDSTILWIPVLDIIANAIAVAITFLVINKLRIKISVSGLRDCFGMIKDSFFYFLSSIATTAFSALNTLLVGIYMSDDLAAVANWNVCLTIILAIQNLYAPICNGIYPHMIKERSLKFIHRVLAIFMPIVAVGCVFSFFAAELALLVVGGEEYVEAYPLFRWMIPILFFSFPAQLYGWPTLGAIGKVKETTASTTIAAVIQILGLVALMVFGAFDLVSLAILRGVTEMILMAIRMALVYKNKRQFVS